MGGESASGERGRERARSMPDTYRDPAGRARRLDEAEPLALEVDGERFEVRVATNPATGYTDVSYSWLSGPHPDYGFGIGGARNQSLDQHRQRIREFLAMVDPQTGYIED